MSLVKKYRIESIDLLRGLVMVIMALDHVRDYFHINAILSNDPTNLETTTPFLFFTRFITHYCAPTFVFLAGTSAFLYGRNKSKKQLFKFLFTRGIWLIIVEIVIMNVLWWFDLSYGFINLQVIWAIGLCMVLLSLIIFLPKKIILLFGLLMVFGHNSMDGITAEGNGPLALLWYITHQFQTVTIGNRLLGLMYPIIPWVAVMSLGYVFGSLYHREFSSEERKKWLLRLGFGCLAVFVLVRGLNAYGDLVPWSEQRNGVFTFLSFMNVSKYPPSLAYLLITLGPGFLFLFVSERWSNKITDFFLVFGRVPFFFYVIHVFVIHSAAILLLVVLGKDWTILVGSEMITTNVTNGYGYPLWVVYLVWVLIVIALYFPSRWFMNYKARNRDKWWLSYL